MYTYSKTVMVRRTQATQDKNNQGDMQHNMNMYISILFTDRIVQRYKVLQSTRALLACLPDKLT